MTGTPAENRSEETAALQGETGADLDTGLTRDEVDRRLAQYGPNALEEKRVSPLLKFLAFFWGPIPWMIEVAAILSAVVRRWEDFAIIMLMLLVNAGVGFWQAFKADNAIAALKQTLALRAHVLRDGKWRDIPARELVPGDVIFLRLGNIVPADARLARGQYLSVDESALTGESLPVDKATGDKVYSSSVVKNGEMRAVVTAIGAGTYFGRTARLVETAGAKSHFQQAVLRIGNFLILSTLALVALILTVALFRGDPLVETLLFTLILTVAAIPVALPAVLSVTMAVGATRLARMKAIVSRLVSIEEMAGVTLLCADKTGTLTKNELTLGQPVLLAANDAHDVILAAALASTAESPDAIDMAVIKGLENTDELKAYGVLDFKPFDPVRKRTEARIGNESGQFQVAKGAPQAILRLCDTDPAIAARVSEETDTLAASGYRTLGVARTDDGGKWRYLGLLPLFDPPRPDSRDTIRRTKEMGVDIRMVTGDHVAIAREIARKIGLGTNIVIADEMFEKGNLVNDGQRIEAADGFAQVFPEHKFRIVKELQGHGHIVGMTGDGVNDAPALKQANMGIAVSGATDAARAAADLVLTGAGLTVITRAIEEARKIFERMNSYAMFRIAETVRVLLFMTLSILVFNFYPVTAVMIVLLAILNDLPIMAIAYDNVAVARHPVRWNMHRVLTLSVALGVTGVVATFGLFWIAEKYLQLPRETVRTLMFLKLLVAGHLTIYVTRNPGLIWDRPWPNWKLIVSAETTQLFGTLAAVYGWFVTPIGWTYALAVWGYSLVWLLVDSAVKINVYRLLDYRMPGQERHIKRVAGSLHEHGDGPRKAGRTP